MNLTHCNKPVKSGKTTRNGKTIFAVWCESCGQRGEGATRDEAVKAFRSAGQPRNAQNHAQPPALPVRPDQLPEYVAGNMGEITQLTAPFVSHDRPAMARLVKNNVRYALTLTGKPWDKIWSKPEGQQSVVRGFEEAMILGAELGKMGDLVPFGDVCEFIPAIEAYEFALTTGNSAPFEWVNVEPIYENDIVKVGRKDGHFSVSFENIPSNRGRVISVVVYGKYLRLSDPLVIGERYDAERLIEKAKAHSPSYRSYLQKKNLYERMKSEQGEETDSSGRDFVLIEAVPEDDPYFAQNKERFDAAEKAGELKGSGKNQYAEVDIPKKGGDTFTKKIYRKDIEGGATERLYRDTISNPYDGPDRPEMLRKAAGKSFLAKYVKVRNSVAAMDELREQPDNVEEALDGALDAAMSQFDGGGSNTDVTDVTDADYTVEDEDDDTPQDDPETPDNEPVTTPPPGDLF